MEKCVQCGVQFGQYEGFGEVCQGCYIEAFELKFAALLKGGKK